MRALHARDIAWQPAWEVTRAAHLARLRTALVGVRDPLIHALLAEIRTLRRWRGYAQAERDGFLLVLARQNETIHRLRTESRRRSTNVAAGARVPDGPADLGHDAETRRRGMRRPAIGAMEGRDASRQAVPRRRADAPQTPNHTVRPHTADSHPVF